MKREKILRNPYIRISIVVTTLAIIVFGIVFLSIIAYRTLFKENPHFALQRIVVKSSGYWNDRNDEIMRILDLHRGVNNLFDLDAGSLKEELIRQKEYSIENVEVYKRLPDTLQFNITERIPRALLYNRKSDLIIDGEAVLINKDFCVDIDSELPIITGFRIKEIKASQSLGKEKIQYGNVLFQLKPALALIKLININYPQFAIKLINLYNENELAVFMPGPLKGKIIRVLFPFNYSKEIPLTPLEYKKGVKLLNSKLGELKKLYQYLRLSGKDCSEIIMLYKGQAVVK